MVCHMAIAAHCPTLRDSLIHSMGMWMTQSTDDKVEDSTHSGSLPTRSVKLPSIDVRLIVLILELVSVISRAYMGP